MAPEEHLQREQIENQVWNAIAAFEQIVETIPDDRVSLEALSHAYEQVGDLARSRDYLLRLANAIATENDRDAAILVRDRLTPHAGDPLVQEAVNRLDALLVAGKPAREFEIPPVDKRQEAQRKNEESERRSAHIASELSFAWNLFEANQLTQEEYAQIAQDLSEVSSSQTAVTLSVLHTLHDRGNRNIDTIIATVSIDSSTPVLPLALFDVQKFSFELLPYEFIVRYGVMVFDLMGKDALAVILNPYNKALRTDVEKILGRRCHFFMTTPADFDATIEKQSTPEKPAGEKPTP